MLPKLSVLKRKRYKILLLFILCFVFITQFYFFFYIICYAYGYDFENDFLTDIFVIPDNVTCFIPNQNEQSTSLHQDYEQQSPYVYKQNSVFMIYPSCDPYISVHHKCAIEAACRAHTSRHVYVLSAVKLKNNVFLRSIPGKPIHKFKLSFSVINLNDFVLDTPLEGIFDKHFLLTGAHRIDRIVEVLKFVILYKYGGVVVDMNMILAKSTKHLGNNWAPRLNDGLGTEILGMGKLSKIGMRVIVSVMRIIRKQRHQKVIDGKSALTETLYKFCHIQKDKECANFKIYNERFFYPVNKSSNYVFFKPGPLIPISYSYYIWNTKEITYVKDSLYSKILEECCPYSSRSRNQIELETDPGKLSSPTL